jgi:hypothetical protein
MNPLSQVKPFITTLNLLVALFGLIAIKSPGAMGIYLYLRSILVRACVSVCVFTSVFKSYAQIVLTLSS